MKLKLLVVDDEPWVREGIAKDIEWGKYGIEVVGEAESGQEAIELAFDIRPDIIITDIRMPDIDGLKFSEAVKSILPETKIIIISGYDEFRYAQKAIELNVLSYLLKPIDIEELINKVLRAKDLIENERGQLKSILSRHDEDLDHNKRLIKKAISYICDHIFDDISLNTIAEFLNISPNYLSKIFRDVTNSSFIEYVLSEKIKKAAELLDDTDMKVYEVAERLGYKDSDYFTRLFKRYIGMTPAQYKGLKR